MKSKKKKDNKKKGLLKFIWLSEVELQLADVLIREAENKLNCQVFWYSDT